MPGRAQAVLEAQSAALTIATPVDEVARREFRDARDALLMAVAGMLRAGLTLDDLLDECGMPRGGMRSALRAMAGRYSPDDLIAAIEAQKGSQ